MPDALLLRLNEKLVSGLPRLDGPYQLVLDSPPARLGLVPGHCGPSRSGWHVRRLHDDLNHLYWRLGVRSATYLCTPDEQRRTPLSIEACQFCHIQVTVTVDLACLHQPSVVFLAPDSPHWTT